MTIYDEIKKQFSDLAKAAKLNLISSDWDEFTHDFGSFKFATREQAKVFMAIMPKGYSAKLLGPTTSVCVEIV